MRGLPAQGIWMIQKFLLNHPFLHTRLPIMALTKIVASEGFRSLYGCGTAGDSHPFPLLHSLLYVFLQRFYFLTLPSPPFAFLNGSIFSSSCKPKTGALFSVFGCLYGRHRNKFILSGWNGKVFPFWQWLIPHVTKTF